MTALPLDLQPIDWNSVDGAIFDWVAEVLFPEDPSQVIWGNQNIAQPSYPYASLLRTSGPTKEGGIDETRCVYNAANPTGYETDVWVVGSREFTLSVSAHVDDQAGGYDPNCNGVFMLSKLQASLGLSSIKSKFAKICVAVIEELSVEDTSVEVNGEWISGATMDVRFRVTSQIFEHGTIIDKVALSSTIDGASDSLDLDDEIIDLS